MVDLDSNPTKLIEIVETGKQLLMTRGALTTFSVANDVSKYFAIIPVMFASTYPVLAKLNVMHLSPATAVLSALIFNALIIVALIPIALRGVKYRPQPASILLRNNIVVYGIGGLIIPFIGIKLIDMLSECVLKKFNHEDTKARRRVKKVCELKEEVVMNVIRPTIVSFVILTAITGVVYPLVITGVAKVAFPVQAEGSMVTKEGVATTDEKVAVGSSLIGQNFDRPEYFWGRPSATSPQPYNASSSSGSNLGPSNSALTDAIKGRIDVLAEGGSGE